jgi:2-C-methyl-D-erythritol 2,4-cyclodiphosphate synthase
MSREYRVGQGYDIHRIATERPLFLCGVRVPYSMGLLGHSDADVGLHAVIDAMLGAAGAGDIGERFPDTAVENRGKPSSDMLSAVLAELTASGWRVENVDLTIITEQPKLKPHKPAMRAKLAELCAISPDRIGIKAKTNETLGAVGREEAMICNAVVLLSRAGAAQ